MPSQPVRLYWGKFMNMVGDFDTALSLIVTLTNEITSVNVNSVFITVDINANDITVDHNANGLLFFSSRG